MNLRKNQIHGASHLRSESGLRESEKTVAVKMCSIADTTSRKDGFIASEEGRDYLPIGIVGLDDAKGLALIELPHQSDAGIFHPFPVFHTGS